MKCLAFLAGMFMPVSVCMASEMPIIQWFEIKQDKDVQPTVAVPKQVSTAYPDVAKGFEEVYDRFMNAKLIYTNPYTQEKIEWKFGDIMPQMFQGGRYSVPFDLSGCDGATQKNVSINIGFRTEKGGDKAEVWIMPRFWLAAHINDAAKHYKPILDKWSQSIPAGILWTYGGWQADDGDCVYDVTETYEDLSNNENLYKKYVKNPGVAVGVRPQDAGAGSAFGVRGGRYPYDLSYFILI